LETTPGVLTDKLDVVFEDDGEIVTIAAVAFAPVIV